MCVYRVLTERIGFSFIVRDHQHEAEQITYNRQRLLGESSIIGQHKVERKVPPEMGRSIARLEEINQVCAELEVSESGSEGNN